MTIARVVRKTTLAEQPKDVDYWQSFPVVPIIAFSIIFGALRHTSTTGLLINNKTRIISVVTVLISLLNLGLNLGLIPLFNVMGAALATLLTQAAYFSIILYYSQKHYHIPYELKKVCQMIILGAILTGIAFLFNNVSIIPRLLIKLLLIGSFPFLLYFLNFYEKVELERISGAYQKWKNPKNWRRNPK